MGRRGHLGSDNCRVFYDVVPDNFLSESVKDNILKGVLKVTFLSFLEGLTKCLGPYLR